MTNANGDTYDGDWEQGEKHGRGIEKWKNDEKFIEYRG